MILVNDILENAKLYWQNADLWVAGTCSGVRYMTANGQEEPDEYQKCFIS